MPLCLPVTRTDFGSGPCPLWSRSCLGALVPSHGINHCARTDGLQMSIFPPLSPGLTHLVSYQTSPFRSLTDISNLISQIKPLIFTPLAWKWCYPRSLLMPQHLNHFWSSFPSLPPTSSPMANLSVLPSKLYLCSLWLLVSCCIPQGDHHYLSPGLLKQLLHWSSLLHLCPSITSQAR